MYYNFLVEFLKKETGIVISEENSYLLEDRITKLLPQLGFNNLSDLADFLQKNTFGKSHQLVIDAMTTNETSFFRDAKFFDALIKHFIPAMIARRKNVKHLKIWSAACSTGQEAYSVAILLREHFPELYDWKIEIFASDICQQVLNVAKNGMYSALEVSRGINEELLSKYFVKRDNQWQVIDKIRELITFQKMNLFVLSAVPFDADLIFLRNVLIYFDNEDKKKVINNVSSYLMQDGFLFLGASEINVCPDWHIQMTRVGGCECYIKK